MPFDAKEFFDGLAILTDQHNMRVTLKNSAKGAIVCGVSCFVGGVVAGPVGLAIGGAIGGAGAAVLSRGQFKPVGTIIRHELTERQRRQLLEHITAACNQLEPSDLTILLPLILNSTSIQQIVLKTIATFITNEMRLTIID